MSNIHNLQADLDLKDNVLISIACKQLDDLELELDIWNDGQEIDLSNYSCRLTAIKIDGVPFIQDTAYTIVKNKVKIQCERQLTATQGITKADLIFIDKATKKQKHSFNLDIIVKPSVLSRSGEISKPTLTLLEQIDKKLDEIENIGQVLDEAKKTRDDLVVKTNIANECEKNLIQTTAAADNKKKEVEGTISNASKKITEVNTSIDNANNTKNSLISTAAEKVKELKDTADLEKQSIINTVDIKKEEVNKLISNADTKKGELENTLTVTTTKKEQLDGANTLATKNIETLNSFGDASQLTKDVTTLKTKVLENTLTSIETDNVLTKLDNCENGFVRNMQIRGKTLQNVWSGGSVYYISSENRLRETVILDLYKTNINYTLVNYSNKKIKFGIFTKSNVYSRTIEVLPNSKLIILLNDEIIKDKIGEESNGWENTDLSKNELKKSIVILEGDCTGKEIPPYFEGIKSVGELEGNKFSILSRNSNFCSMNKLRFYKAENTGREFELDKIPKGNYNLNYNGTDKGNLKLYYITKDWQKHYPNPNGDFTIEDNEYERIYIYIDQRIYDDNTLREYTNIKINRLDKIVSYEPCKSDTTEILLPNEPLRGIGNGIADVVNYDKNEITRNVGKYVFNGDEGWKIINGTKNSTLLFETPYIPNMYVVKDKSTILNVVCNKLISSSADKGWLTDTEEVICQDSSTKCIRINILKSKLETPDANALKKLLKSWSDAGTPLEVCYQLANPVTEKLNIKDTLQTFQDGYIQLDNAITPCTSLEYSTNLPSALGGLTKVTDRLVDDVTNVEITISDLDAEIGEARKGKTTLEERLEEDKTNILKKFNDYAKKDGTLQTGLNAEMLGGLISKDFQKCYGGNINDFNTALTQGEYSFNSGALHQPNNYKNYGKLIVLVSDGGTHNNLNNWIWQIMYPTEPSIGIWYRNKSNDGSWSKWKQIATTETAEITQFQNGWTKFSDDTYGSGLSKVGNIVTISILVSNPSPITGLTIFVLPQGFRPNKNVIFIINQGTNIFEARIYPNGDVRIEKGIPEANNWNNIQVTYQGQ